MKKSVVKILLQLFVFELLYIFVLRLGFDFIPHQNIDIIYHININLYYLIAVFTILNLSMSRVNKMLITLLAIWFTLLSASSVFGTFNLNFSYYFNFIYYNLINVFISTFHIQITLFIFLLALSPYKSNKQHLLGSFVLTLIVSSIVYVPIFYNGSYKEGYEILFRYNYYMYILNFSFLVVFWQQYTLNKILFSEYLPNIMTVYTFVVLLEIFHMFSSQNELIFHYFGQYFNAILNAIMLILWMFRLNYLHLPESVKNEKFIENYDLLQGIVNKPRSGYLFELYFGLNRLTVFVIISLMIFLGFSLFLFNYFQVFIKLNILILILATVVSIIMAVVSWHKRWYDAIGFFFKKKKK